MRVTNGQSEHAEVLRKAAQKLATEPEGVAKPAGIRLAELRPVTKKMGGRKRFASARGQEGGSRLTLCLGDDTAAPLAQACCLDVLSCVELLSPPSPTSVTAMPRPPLYHNAFLLGASG